MMHRKPQFPNPEWRAQEQIQGMDPSRLGANSFHSTGRYFDTGGGGPKWLIAIRPDIDALPSGMRAKIRLLASDRVSGLPWSNISRSALPGHQTLP